jgi:hypothetical protein
MSAWDDDAALDAFLADDPLEAAGYRVRLSPVRIVGEWPWLGSLPEPPADQPQGRVAVLTLGRLRLRRALPFLRASAAAERDALESPALVVSSGLARPPHLVSTFSVWRDVAAMRAYVQTAHGGHRSATAAHGQRAFHHESAFIRFAITEERGSWD